MPKRLAIVGAGPKAAALAARAAVLRTRRPTGSVPELIVIERDSPGAAWSGDNYYSNGFETLCTPGEKDVGFPYNDDWADRAGSSIASELYARFSFGAYLVAEGRFADWVDRERDHPSHSRFADYLDWVFGRAEQDITQGTVKNIRHDGSAWHVTYAQGSKDRTIKVDGVILTGNGEPRSIALGPNLPPGRVLTAETFWQSRDELLKPGSRVEVAVAGDGGSAGTIVAWLARRFAETNSQIISISPMGTLFPRGDGHAERRWFTDPTDWPRLSLAHRRKLMERTEAGVISMRNKKVIDGSTRIAYQVGYLDQVQADDDDKLMMSIKYEGKAGDPVSADYLVNAIGFDPWTRLSLVDHPAAQALAKPVPGLSKTMAAKQRDDVEEAIAHDLSMPTTEGFPEGLHVPALSGLAQGPGMGNLGCLGTMAQRILKPYIT
jgi:mycobactin lysine-N-oxygenase